MTLSGAITGPAGLTTIGAGQLTVSGMNNFQGGTAVQAGTFIVTTPSSLLDGSTLIVGANAATYFSTVVAAANVPAVQPVENAFHAKWPASIAAAKSAAPAAQPPPTVANPRSTCFAAIGSHASAAQPLAQRAAAAAMARLFADAPDGMPATTGPPLPGQPGRTRQLALDAWDAGLAGYAS